MQPNSKPSSVVSEIKLKSACLFATKSDIDEQDFSKSVCYAFVCKEALFSFEDVPSVGVKTGGSWVGGPDLCILG